ncbi:MAG: zinc ribbon domain-containing protein, partial [Anaerolineales bacterium]|nr:zinc ribbon domain-containing protein [Anaerolineales bacterium]
MANKSLGYIELNWTCPNCSAVNLGSNKTCSACGNPQPENIQFIQQTTQTLLEDEEKIKQARKGADVHCPYCGTRNSAEKETCRQCGGDLTDGARRVAGRIIGAYGSISTTTNKDRACPSCQQPNQPNALFCVYCGTPLQMAAHQTSNNFISPSAAPLKNKDIPSQTSTTRRKKLPVWLIL